jgi:hypoxanthine phosphoribosyltransferase
VGWPDSFPQDERFLAYQTLAACQLPISNRGKLDFMLTGLIGVISGLCTIAVTAVAIYAWLRSHALIIRVHDPKKVVQGSNLSIVDVQRAMERMTEDAREFQPNHIVAINRGGAIVGGWLAKQLGHKAPIVVIVNSDEPPQRRVIPQSPHDITLSGKVYLVDDAQRKGEHMRETTEYLMAKHPNLQVRRAVLLQMSIPHKGPETVAFRGTRSEFNGFMTHDANVLLPWDDGSPGL